MSILLLSRLRGDQQIWYSGTSSVPFTNMAERSQLSVTKPSIACNGAGSVLGALLPLPLYFLLITSQRRDDIWQKINITDRRRVTGHKGSDIVKVPQLQCHRLCERFRVCLKVSCKWKFLTPLTISDRPSDVDYGTSRSRWTAVSEASKSN
jgi:hypothetical protein